MPDALGLLVADPALPIWEGLFSTVADDKFTASALCWGLFVKARLSLGTACLDPVKKGVLVPKDSGSHGQAILLHG